MERNELAGKLESIARTLQYQILNNLDALVAPAIRGDGKISQEALEMMVKKPMMEVVICERPPMLDHYFSETDERTCLRRSSRAATPAPH